VRTPLPALTTLQDDPLRVLRAVRFAARFQFDVSDDLLTAGSDASVHTALRTKVGYMHALPPSPLLSSPLLSSPPLSRPVNG